jgi:hypothetical protein
MRTALFAFAWAFILAVAAYDSHFAWRFRQEIYEWEMNPFALWAASAFGLPAIIGGKLVILTFAMCLATYCRHRHHPWALPMTAIIGCAYLLLSLYYWVGQLPADGSYGIPKNRIISVASITPNASSPVHPFLPSP